MKIFISVFIFLKYSFDRAKAWSIKKYEITIFQISFKSETCSETTAPYKRCLELTAPTELIIINEEAPPENNCKRIICDAPPNIIKDIPIVANGLKPISIDNIPKINPKGTTGIINGLTSIIPFEKT